MTPANRMKKRKIQVQQKTGIIKKGQITHMAIKVTLAIKNLFNKVLVKTIGKAIAGLTLMIDTRGVMTNLAVATVIDKIGTWIISIFNGESNTLIDPSNGSKKDLVAEIEVNLRAKIVKFIEGKETKEVTIIMTNDEILKALIHQVKLKAELSELKDPRKVLTSLKLHCAMALM